MADMERKSRGTILNDLCDLSRSDGGLEFFEAAEIGFSRRIRRDLT